jgi:hypothetical protein
MDLWLDDNRRESEARIEREIDEMLRFRSSVLARQLRDLCAA